MRIYYSIIKQINANISNQKFLYDTFIDQKSQMETPWLYWGVVGAPVAGAERDRLDSSGSFGRGLLRGLGRSRARGRPSKRVTGAERLLEGR